MKKHLTFSLALLTIVCSTVTAQLPSYLPADGLVGWWPFNGNANDESGNGNDGTPLNGVALTTDRFGSVNSAYNFDGIDDYIQHLYPGPSGTGITLSYWFKTDRYVTSGNYSDVFSYGGSSWGTLFEANFNHWSAQTSGPCFGPSLTAAGTLISRGSDYVPDSSLWHQAVIILPLNATNLEATRIFLDGVELTGTCSFANYGAPTINIGTSNSIRIGKGYQNGALNFEGGLDDIAIYNRALTPQEIQNLYNGSNETVDTGDGAAPLPQGIPYQAAARDAQGQVIADAPVNVRFSLHEGAVDGAVSYSETHALTTNSIGLFNTVFGNGTPEQSAFDSINWAATTKFLQVEIDLGDGYVDMGTTQLLSVPYAFRSDEAARIKNAGLPIFANNTAALAGGLMAGEMYRTASGDLKVAY
jgi:hypothetical protein